MESPIEMTRQTYLVLAVMAEGGADYFTAMEAVSSVAIEHPEWDMQERRSIVEWERDMRASDS